MTVVGFAQTAAVEEVLPFVRFYDSAFGFCTSVLSTLPADSTPEVLQTQGGNAHVFLLDALLILVSFCTLPAYATPNLRPKAGGNARVFVASVCLLF